LGFTRARAHTKGPKRLKPCMLSNTSQQHANFVGLAYQGKDILFRLIREYSGLKDFGPWVIIGLFLCENFFKMIFWLVLKLEIRYRVLIS
jgi:hypothetical protein